MTMRFRYRRYPTKAPVISLGGRTYRSRPVFLVTILGPSGTYVDDCLLDTGADDTVFPALAAVDLGIDLTKAPAGEAASAGDNPVSVKYAQVKFRLTDSREYREWDAWIAFTSVPLNQPLLDFAGFQQYFYVQLDNENELVDLSINKLYTGI